MSGNDDESEGARDLPLPTAEFGEALLPHRTEADFDFEAVHEILVLRRLKLGEVPRQQLSEDRAEVTLERMRTAR